MTETLYLGIDPGLSGAFALLFPDDTVQTWQTPVTKTRFKYPKAKTKSGKPKVKITTEYDFRDTHMSLYQIRKLVAEEGMELVVGIERQRGRETDSKHTVAQVGRNQGIWEALVGANNLEYRIVDPTAWKPAYLPPGAQKSASLAIAVELFPKHDFEIRESTGELFKREEAKAEALLIADYCRRKDQGLDFLRVRAPRGSKKPTAPKRKSQKKRRSKALP